MEQTLRDQILSLVNELDGFRFCTSKEAQAEKNALENELEVLEEQFHTLNGFYLNY